jgi:hypothetical protein
VGVALVGALIAVTTAVSAVLAAPSSPAPQRPHPDPDFSISGSAVQLFTPGVRQPLNLTVTNPFNFSIKVVNVSISVWSATTRSGRPNPNCSGTQNLIVARPFSGSVVVPANSRKSFSELGLSQRQWPLLQMPDLPTNQDGCKNTNFKLAYTGTATKPSTDRPTTPEKAR